MKVTELIDFLLLVWIYMGKEIRVEIAEWCKLLGIKDEDRDSDREEITPKSNVIEEKS